MNKRALYESIMAGVAKGLKESSYKVIELNSCSAEIFAKKGFMMFDPNTESVVVYQYDNIKDLEELGIDISEDFYKELDMLKIGRSGIDYLTGAIHTRIK